MKINPRHDIVVCALPPLREPTPLEQAWADLTQPRSEFVDEPLQREPVLKPARPAPALAKASTQDGIHA